jgi:hypothetical protein
MNFYQTRITRMALLCLLFSTNYGCKLFAQDEGPEKKQIGYRLETANAVTIYADYSGSPNFGDRYSLTNKYFIVVNGDTLRNDGVLYTKISIPGPVNPNAQVQARTKIAQDERSTKKINDGRSAPAYSEETVVCESAFNRVFWIKTEDLPVSEHPKNKVLNAGTSSNIGSPPSTKSKLWLNEFRYSRWSVGALSVPFKYRFSYKDTVRQLAGESSVGLCLTWDFFRSRSFDERFSIIASAGLTSINPNSVFDDSSATKKKNTPGASICLGVVGTVNKIQFGLIYGYDLADKDWVFDKKPWAAISIGYAFITPRIAGKGN